LSRGRPVFCRNFSLYIDSNYRRFSKRLVVQGESTAHGRPVATRRKTNTKFAYITLICLHRTATHIQSSAPQQCAVAHAAADAAAVSSMVCQVGEGGVAEIPEPPKEVIYSGASWERHRIINIHCAPKNDVVCAVGVGNESNQHFANFKPCCLIKLIPYVKKISYPCGILSRLMSTFERTLK